MRESINDLPIGSAPHVLPPEDTSDKETLSPQTSDLTYAPNASKLNAHSQVVGVENAGGKP